MVNEDISAINVFRAIAGKSDATVRYIVDNVYKSDSKTKESSKKATVTKLCRLLEENDLLIVNRINQKFLKYNLSGKGKEWYSEPQSLEKRFEGISKLQNRHHKPQMNFGLIPYDYNDFINIIRKEYSEIFSENIGGSTGESLLFGRREHSKKIDELLEKLKENSDFKSIIENLLNYDKVTTEGFKLLAEIKEREKSLNEKQLTTEGFKILEETKKRKKPLSEKQEEIRLKIREDLECIEQLYSRMLSTI